MASNSIPPILIGDSEKAKAVISAGGGIPLLTKPLEKTLSQIVLEISKSKMNSKDDDEDVS